MPGLPPYRSKQEADTMSRAIKEEAARRVQGEVANDQARSVHALHMAVPLLRDHAQESARAIEITRKLRFRKKIVIDRIIGGWVIGEITHDHGLDPKPRATTYWTLTEEEKILQTWSEDRAGIEVLKANKFPCIDLREAEAKIQPYKPISSLNTDEWGRLAAMYYFLQEPDPIIESIREHLQPTPRINLPTPEEGEVTT